MTRQANIVSVTRLLFNHSGNSIAQVKCGRQETSVSNTCFARYYFHSSFIYLKEFNYLLACRTLGFDLRFISVTSHFTCDIHQPRRDSEPLSMTCGLSKLGAWCCQVLIGGFIFCLRVTVSVGRPCSSRSLCQQKEQHIQLSLE